MNTIYQNECEVDFAMETHSITKNNHVIEYDLEINVWQVRIQKQIYHGMIVLETPTYNAPDRKLCRISIDDCTEMIKNNRTMMLRKFTPSQQLEHAIFKIV